MTADQAAYLLHLEQEHELVDDPGTTSAVEPEPVPEPPPWPPVPPIDLPDSPSLEANILRPGERALSTLFGGKPAADGAALAAGMAGGALGVLVLRAVRGKRTPPDPTGRALIMTSERVVLVEQGDVAVSIPLTEIKYAKVRRSQAGSSRKIVEITSRDQRKIHIEGPTDDVKAFITSIPQPT